MSEYEIVMAPMDGPHLQRPDGTKVQFQLNWCIEELNELLARAEKAETALANREVVLAQMQSALKATYAETHHPDIGASERKPMMPHERIEWLGKDRDNWEARAKAAESERDELMRKLSEARVKEHWESSETERQLLRRAEAAEAKLVRFMSIPSCSPEIVVPALQSKRDPIDWQRARIDAAIAALEGMLACRGGGDAIERAKVATEYADALVAELKEEVAE